MNKNIVFKMAILFLVVGSSFIFSSEYGEKRFGVETAMILYKISGKARLENDVNLTIKGKGKLRFKNWGVDALISESYTETTTGNINNISKIKIVKKFENSKRYDVDFDTNKILERPMPKGSFRDDILNGLTSCGTENIAGIVCDVWEGKGVKKCIYKGIPLLVEHYILGNYYQKKAVEVKLDIKPCSDKCKLPDFELKKFGLFTTNIKTKTVKIPVEFAKLIDHIYKKIEKDGINLDEITIKQKKELFNMFGDNIFKKQQKLLSEYLTLMKKARVCMAQSKDENDSKTCLVDIESLKQQINSNNEYTTASWTTESKNSIENILDNNIFNLQSKMKCIRASKNIFDLSNCMK